MDERRGVRAPYNFVPFSGRILLPYAGPAELPSHSELRPDLRSGELHVTLEAETPVFVSDGRGFFFRDAGGRYAIPGSTVRGITRENMQILASAPSAWGGSDGLPDLFPADRGRVQSADQRLRADYADALGVFEKKNPRPAGRSASPGAVASGYLRRGRNGYVIRRRRGRTSGLTGAGQMCSAWARGTPGLSRWTTGRRTGSWRRSFPPAAGPPGCAGACCCTRKAGEQDPQSPLPVSGGGLRRPGAAGAGGGYPLLPGGSGEPEKRCFWPFTGISSTFGSCPPPASGSRYFTSDTRGTSISGPHCSCGSAYQYPLSAGLPRRHREMMGQEDGPLDYPRAILGFASQKRSYRSRVSFGDLTAVGEPPGGGAGPGDAGRAQSPATIPAMWWTAGITTR